MTLIYDGDCGFCRTWIDYWKTRTGDRVRYVSIEESREEFPDLPVEQLKQRVHLVTPEGVVAGAEAVFQTLGGFGLTLYRKLPGFATVTEFAYERIAKNRDAAFKVTRLLWGTKVERSRYTLAALIFARLLSFVYLIAFASAGIQVRGLIGEQGILPVAPFLNAVRNALGTTGYFRAPSIFWFGNSDFALLSVCWGGVALATVSIIARPWGKFHQAVYAILFLYYLSIVKAGQIFFGFQWDYLLLEVGFLAIFLRPVRSRVWLFHLLLFRLMFESGVGKLLSGDATWRTLNALDYHFQTQPLPTVIGWYAHQLPGAIHRAATLAMFGVELVLPFFIFGPRRMKQVAAFGTILLQVLIFATGNYTFFNLLTAALCVLLLDDQMLRSRWKPPVLSLKPANESVTAVLTAFCVGMGLISLTGVFTPLPKQIAALESMQASFGLVNRYGLFSVMTTTRLEIEVEGSLDGQHWLPLRFRYKPGRLDRAPGWVAPFQPRLDWQMWFAALAPPKQNPWVVPLMLRILEGSKPVLELLDPGGPFGMNAPKFVRASVYEYKFTSFSEKSQTGNYWKRELKGMYFPSATLQGRPAVGAAAPRP